MELEKMKKLAKFLEDEKINMIVVLNVIRSQLEYDALNTHKHPADESSAIDFINKTILSLLDPEYWK